MPSDHQAAFLKLVTATDDETLLRILAVPHDYTPGALAAAKAEVSRRGGAQRLHDAIVQREGLATSTADLRPPPPMTQRRFASVVGALIAVHILVRILSHAAGVGGTVAVIFMGAWGAAGYAILIGASTRRLQEMRCSGSLILLLFFPYLNLVLVLYLLVWDGVDGVEKVPSVR
jgi:hypothetical protein